MKKNLLFLSLILGVICFANFKLNQAKADLSSLEVSNIEALASGEGYEMGCISKFREQCDVWVVTPKGGHLDIFDDKENLSYIF